jgi:3' terminal RNA ribose 2'-O-methyltransferase Hen1
LGYLLYKNPYRPQVFELSHGKAYVFYPEVSDERTTAALLLDIDPIDLARGKAGQSSGGLFDYVNDRPYVSSSFLSTAISKVFGTAMTGRADSRQALSDSPLDLAAAVTMLPCRGEQEKLRSVFEPLGYEVGFETFVSDESFPGWGESKYVNLTIRGKVRLRDLLKHLYVLIPVFDRQKHYWVGPDEVEKLLRIGEDWLPQHPEKAYITGRYLNRRRSLVNLAFERLAESNAVDGEVLPSEPEPPEDAADKADKKLNLNTQRLGSVVAALKSCGAKHVIDLGCGEGNLLKLLAGERQFTKITGVDVSHVALKRAGERLKLDRAGDAMRERIQLLQGSLTYKDARFAGYDAACVVEVIEHMDIPRLAAFERVLFEFAKPRVVVLSTPNREYNANYESLRDGGLRHGDHRFEWTRAEFRAWANKTADAYGYAVQFSEVGDIDRQYGAPTQMGVFTLCG